MQQLLSRAVLVLAYALSALAQVPGGRGNNGPSQGQPNQSPGSNSNISPELIGAALAAQYGAAAVTTRQNALIAHAVLACLTWAFFVPLGGIFLRLNLNSPWALRAHILTQLSSVLMFITAVGLGVYLIQSFDTFTNWMWQDVHPRLGLAILGLTLIQPILGMLHHRKFKRRLSIEHRSRRPIKSGRTAWGHAHLWLGRALIILGVVNGGLGLHLSHSHLQLVSFPTESAIKGYAAGAAVMMAIFFCIVVVFEWRRARGRRMGKRNRTRTELTASSEEKNVDRSNIEPKHT